MRHGKGSVPRGSGGFWNLPFTKTAAEDRLPAKAYEDATYGLAFSPDGARLAVSGAYGHAVRVWRWEAGELEMTLTDTAHPDWIDQLAFSADSRLLASGDEYGEVQVWDAAGGELVLQHRFDDAVKAVRFEAGHRLLVVDRDGNIRELQVFPRV